MTLVLAGLLVGACGPKQQPPEAKVTKPIALPPTVPQARNEPRDEQLRTDAGNEIEKGLSSSDEIIRAHSIEAAQNGMGAAGQRLILRGLSDGSPIVRYASAMAAGQLRLDAAKPAVMSLLSDPDMTVRIAAIFCLHKLGDTRYSQNLVEYSRDPRKEVRAATVLALGNMGEKSAIPILTRLRRDRDPAIRIQASEAAWKLGDDKAVEDLVGQTLSKYPDDQMISLLALASTHDQRTIEHIRVKLVDTDYDEVKLVAARAAGMVGFDDGYAVALNGAKSKDPRQRVLAALALGAIGRRDAQGILGGLLRDSDADVRLAAATAILQLR